MRGRSRRLGFALKRPWLFVRGLLISRDRPNLKRLESIDDPERFVWAVLPHAARTFAPSIVALPYRRAIVAAVGYLYARMLDTYEDLEDESEHKLTGLRGFATRFEWVPPVPSPTLVSAEVRDDRDRVHLLLIDRCSMVDSVFAGFDADDQQRVIDMLKAMSAGMAESVELMAQQGGVLDTAAQVEDYCHTVIGHPISFTMRLVVGEEAATQHRSDAMDLSVLIQLANVTRDIEKDLERGIAYHPALRTHLGEARKESDGAIVAARRDLVVTALRQVPAYRRLIEDLELPRFSLARGSAVLMALYTDRHYRRAARQAELESWGGPKHTTAIWMVALPAIVSSWWTSRVMRRIETDSAAAVQAAPVDTEFLS
ncbi:MAG: squalene/phytoene synthase family protein [Acidimicrobiia bacterium]|nr:squalene/phytoene synthase family protein [Acidimicrobiia bacterium]